MLPLKDYPLDPEVLRLFKETQKIIPLVTIPCSLKKEIYLFFLRGSSIGFIPLRLIARESRYQEMLWIVLN